MWWFQFQLLPEGPLKANPGANIPALEMLGPLLLASFLIAKSKRQLGRCLLLSLLDSPHNALKVLQSVTLFAILAG